MKLGRKILESYLAIVIGILTVVTFFILSGTRAVENTSVIFLGILIIILISVNILNAIINLRIHAKQSEEK